MRAARGSASGVGGAGEHADRPDAGIELEAIAEIEMRRDFGAVGIPHVGQSHRAEQDGIGRLGSLQRTRPASASPVRRYRSAPASKEAKSSAKPPTRSATASSSATHGGMTSTPIPSPGKTAI